MNAHAARPGVCPTPKSRPDPNAALASTSMAHLVVELESFPAGLTQAEAQKRLSENGPNELDEKKSNEPLKFLRYYRV
jgi:H+-transporting ATPase